MATNLLTGITTLFKGLARQVYQWPVVLAAKKDDDTIGVLEMQDGALRVRLSSGVTLDPGTINIGSVNIKDPATSLESNVVNDGTNSALVITANLLPLPSGAATSAYQDAGNTTLAAIQTQVTVTKGGGAIDAGTQRVTLATDGPGVSNLSTIAANTTGVSTAANQATANTKLDQLHTDLLAATPAGENFIGIAGTGFATAAGTVTRPNTTPSYTSGMLIANSATAGSVTPVALTVARANDKSVMLRRVRLKSTNTGAAGQTIRVHFYKDAPTCTNGDGAAWLTTESNYLGAVDVTLNKTFSDAIKGIGVPNEGTEINCMPSSGTQTIYALLEARSSFSGVAGTVLTLAVEVLQN